MKSSKLFLIYLILVSSTVYGQSQETKIKALFILKFVENVSWPQNRKEVVIGVVGDNEVFDELESRLLLKNANGLIVKKIVAAEAGTVDVVYLPSQEDKTINTIKSKISGKSVLVISESDLSKRGSGISFIEVSGRLNFVINKDAIEAQGLKISGSLLSLGKQV